MKPLILILLIASSTFAHRTLYLDGSECHCDSLSRTYLHGEVSSETPYREGEVQGEYRSYSAGVVMISIIYAKGHRHGTRYVKGTYSLTEFVAD